MIPRGCRYLACELGNRAAGQGATALLLMSAATGLTAASGLPGIGPTAQLAIPLALFAIGLTAGAVRNAARARALEAGDLPTLPARFEVAIRTRVTPLWLNVLGLLLGYGFFGLFVSLGWKTTRDVPDSLQGGLAPVATALMLASGWYLGRGFLRESAAVRLAAPDPDGVAAEVRGTLTAAAAQGISPEKVSVGALLGGMFLLIAYLSLTLDPKCARLAIRMMGERPWGIPWPVALAGLVLVVGAPVVPLAHVALSVMEHRLRTRGRASIRPLGFLWYLFALYDGPDARRARIAVASGVLYFALLTAAWIALAP